MNDDEDDEDKYADDMAMPGQKFETKQRITVRNLRIREDTAKVGHYRSLDDASSHTCTLYLLVLATHTEETGASRLV